MPFDPTQKQQLEVLFQQYSNDTAIEMISLATTDGFPVCTLNRAGKPLEEDSLCAAASTLHSVSNAVAQQILGKAFQVAFIETRQGNVAFVDLNLDNGSYVLMMSAGPSMNIANLRLLLTRLANELSQSFAGQPSKATAC